MCTVQSSSLPVLCCGRDFSPERTPWSVRLEELMTGWVIIRLITPLLMDKMNLLLWNQTKMRTIFRSIVASLSVSQSLPSLGYSGSTHSSVNLFILFSSPLLVRRLILNKYWWGRSAESSGPLTHQWLTGRWLVIKLGSAVERLGEAQKKDYA